MKRLLWTNPVVFTLIAVFKVNINFIICWKRITYFPYDDTRRNHPLIISAVTTHEGITLWLYWPCTHQVNAVPVRLKKESPFDYIDSYDTRRNHLLIISTVTTQEGIALWLYRPCTHQVNAVQAENTKMIEIYCLIKIEYNYGDQESMRGMKTRQEEMR